MRMPLFTRIFFTPRVSAARESSFMKELAAPAIKAAEEERVKFHPESWKKPFLLWLNNIEDWCISRQIWWGHRIPVWYCEKCSASGLIYADNNGKRELSRVSFKNGAQPIVSFDKPEKCPHCGGHDLVQDPDVLDTCCGTEADSI